MSDVRKICVVTGTRAEYGLLRWLLEKIDVSPSTELQLVVTGSHLEPEFGETFRDIESDGFTIAKKVSLMLPSKCGRTGFITSAEPSVLRPNPNIEESTSSITENFRCAARSRGRPMIANG